MDDFNAQDWIDYMLSDDDEINEDLDLDDAMLPEFAHDCRGDWSWKLSPSPRILQWIYKSGKSIVNTSGDMITMVVLSMDHSVRMT